MKGKLLEFKGPKKSERLANRASAVYKNFSHPTYGIALMDYALLEIYNTFKDQDDFYSEQICAKVIEARAFLEFFQGDEDEERDS